MHDPMNIKKNCLESVANGTLYLDIMISLEEHGLLNSEQGRQCMYKHNTKAG
jgi:hypothetical protein